MQTKHGISLWLLLAVLVSSAYAQQPTKGLSNDDVVAMVKNALPEEIILNAIQANEPNFDISANGLIALKKAGVSTKVVDAMLAVATAKKNAMAVPPPAQQVTQPTQTPLGQAWALPTGNPSASAPNASSFQGLAGFMNAVKAAMGGAVPGMSPAAGMGTLPMTGGGLPTVTMVDAGARKELPYEKTFVAKTKSKSNSLTEIAKESAMRSALDAGFTATLNSTTSHFGTSMGGSIASDTVGETSSSIMAGFLAKRRLSETYVWAVSGTTSSTVVSSTTPSLEVNYSNLPGVNPDEFEPTIVKLSPSQGSWRLVGATKERTDVAQALTPEWQVYSSFIENRMPGQVNKLGPGHAQIAPSSPLAAGEYAVVLRPISKAKKFSGADVSANRGDGMLFNSVWSFTVK